MMILNHRDMAIEQVVEDDSLGLGATVIQDTEG